MKQGRQVLITAVGSRVVLAPKITPKWCPCCSIYRCHVTERPPLEEVTGLSCWYAV